MTTELLLVLILLADPSAKPAGEVLAQQLAGRARVVVGPEAAAQLTGRGVNDGDLVAQPQVGDALTLKDPRLAVVRLERVVRGDDVMIEGQAWFLGRHERHTAISGRRAVATVTIEPLRPAADGITGLLAPWFASTAAPVVEAAEDKRLPLFVDSREWMKVIDATATPATPRQRYYRALALLRLNRRPEALAEIEAFRAAAPGHILLTAIEREAREPVATASADGDPDINNPAPADDGGNVLK